MIDATVERKSESTLDESSRRSCHKVPSLCSKMEGRRDERPRSGMRLQRTAKTRVARVRVPASNRNQWAIVPRERGVNLSVSINEVQLLGFLLPPVRLNQKGEGYGS